MRSTKFHLRIITIMQLRLAPDSFGPPQCSRRPSYRVASPAPSSPHAAEPDTGEGDRRVIPEGDTGG